MSSEFFHRTLVVVNVGLATAALILAWRGLNPAPVIKPAPVQRPSKIAATTAAPQPHYPKAASSAGQRRWLVDQLRAMGVPNRILARVALKDLDQHWNRIAAELTMKTRGDPEALTALNLKIEASRDGDLRAALGEAGFKEWDTANMRREIDTGGVEFSPTESETAYALWKKLHQRDLELRQLKSEGKIDQAGASDEYAKDLAEFQGQMKALLGNERYAQSQATGPGAVAASVRKEFAAANPTTSQFQELLSTQQQYNDLRADLARQSGDDEAYVQSLKDLDEARDEEYRRVLGPEAYDALRKQQDPGYTAMKKYQSLWGLDDAKVDYVYGTLKYYQKNTDDYLATVRDLAAKGSQVDWTAVNKSLQQFAQQTKQTLQNYVGPETFDKLQQNGLVQFTPPPGSLPNESNGRPF